MMKRCLLLTALVFTMCFCGIAHANLIDNGNFELLDNRTGNVNNIALNALASTSPKWDVYGSLPGGWYSQTGPGIEVQYNGVVVNAHSPSHYIELDSHPGSGSNSDALQDFDVASNGTLTVSFWYRPRTNTVDDNRIDVYLDGAHLGFASSITDSLNEWQQFSFTTSVTSGQHTLKFLASGIDNTLGGFIDDVDVTVPEPSTMLLLGSALIGCGLLKRRRFRIID